MQEHSILPPSGAAIWRYCQLWLTMIQQYPEEDTEHSKEGTAAHWVWSEIIQCRSAPVGSSAPNGVIITDEMVDGAELFIRSVYAAGAGALDTLHIEEKVNIPAIHEDCFGTPDLWFYRPDKQRLVLVEDKYGFEFVDEFENYQNLSYASGILEKIQGPCIEIEIIIVQPRCYHKSPVRSWVIKREQLKPYIDELHVAAKTYFYNLATPNASTNKGCKNCTGRHACSAYQKAAYKDAEVSFKSTPLELSPAAASLELRYLTRALERLKGRVSGLEEVVLDMVKRGLPVPHHAIEHTEGRMNWKITPREVLTLGELMGINLAKSEPAILTPTQAIKAGLVEDLVTGNAVRDRGMKLIPFDNSKANKVFG